jgi:hypothetical protein
MMLEMLVASCGEGYDDAACKKAHYFEALGFVV